MIIEPWDPRIKSISWTKDKVNTFNYDIVQFVVLLRCSKKIEWQYFIDSEFMTSVGLNETAEQIIIEMLIDKVQPLIDEIYIELKKVEGGSVDVQGRPIWSIAPINIFNNESESPIVKIAQFDEYQEWQYWCTEVGQQFKPVPSKKMLKEKFEQTKKYFAEKDTAIYQAQVDVGSTVQRNLHKLFPALNEIVTCPVCAKLNRDRSSPLDRMIIHLNDEHKWTRGQIADWSESLDIDLEMKENV